MRLLPALPALLMLSLLAGCMADRGLTPQGSIAELKRMLDAQEQTTADLRSKLEEIDKLL